MAGAAWLAARGWAPVNMMPSAGCIGPKTPATSRRGSLGWQRLAFDELLAGQLALGLVRQSQQTAARPRDRRRRSHPRAHRRRAAVQPDQRAARAAGEIAADMAAPHRMLRLLQGDVGSGKTVVALMAMAIAVEAGAQAALMAPTEVLARQHHRDHRAAGREGRACASAC